MLLSHKTSIKLSDSYSNIIGHMCYAAYKLWNVCNYERNHYKELALETYPDWYYQKKIHKEDMWYKQLPSQTAQQVCKQLDEGWKSFYKLIKTKGIDNPKPPNFKHKAMEITYMQNGILHERKSSSVRLSLSKKLKNFMSEQYGIKDNYLYLENKIFKNFDSIKQIKIYPPKKNICEIIVVYEIPDTENLPDNGNYLSVDIGVHNLFSCYDSVSGKTFIAGRKYLSYTRYFDKEISRVQSRWYSLQSLKDVKYPKSSNHIRTLQIKKFNVISDYLHKTTKALIDYCIDNSLNALVVGDITGIRKNSDHGNVNNQNFHALPYKKIYTMLEYKCNKAGINFVLQEESYSSQCSPLAPTVSAKYGNPNNRVKRGLYKDGNQTWNADSVGAYNILRKYLTITNKNININNIKIPYVLKVAV